MTNQPGRNENARTWVTQTHRRYKTLAVAVMLLGMVAGWGITAAVFWPARGYGTGVGGLTATILLNRWLFSRWSPQR